MSLIWQHRAQLVTPWNLSRLNPILLIGGDRVELYDATHINKVVDLSGIGHHPLQATPAAMPTWTQTDAVFGGHGSIYCPLTTWLETDAINLPTPFTILSAIQVSGAFAGNRGWLCDLSSNVKGLQYINSTGAILMYNASPALSITGPNRTDAAIIVSSRVVVGTSTMRTSLSISTTYTASLASSITYGSLTIGKQSGSSNSLQGKIGGLAIFPSYLSDADELRAMRWMSDQYKIGLAA